MSARLGLLISGIVLLAFASYTGVIVAHHGYTGFLELALEEPWGGQMFVDIVIALVLFAVWMHADAAQEQIPFWPYFIAILTTGSIGALAYLVHRNLRRLRAESELDPVAS